MQFRSKLKQWLMFKVLIGMSIYIIMQIHQYRIAIVGWDETVSRDVNDYIFPNISTTLIKPTNFCNSHAFLMIFVCSSPSKFEARQAIRRSWGLFKNVSDTVVNIYFLLGVTMDLHVQQGIETESETHNDIIQENFMDSYNNLTLKSLMLLKLVVKDCNNKVTYVMKTDDDMFVNLVHLVNRLHNIPEIEKSAVLFGYMMCFVHPVRKAYEKWYVPDYMYPSDTYPNYLSGTGYVMSADVCTSLFQVSLQTPLIYLEDVYLTGICAKRAGVRPRHNGNFNFRKVRFNPCQYRRLITSHNYKPDELVELHHHVQNLDLHKECEIFTEKVKKNKTQYIKAINENKRRRIVMRNKNCY